MKSGILRTAVLVVCGCIFFLWGGVPRAQEAPNKWSVKALDGISFGEFRGYEDWRDVAVSRTNTQIKAILANEVMLEAYRSGTPLNGQNFPDGSQAVKIEWSKKVNTLAPYFVEVPDTLKSLDFIEKDSKRFPETHGWGFAEFDYDPATKTFKAYGTDASFNKDYCFKCHIAVASTDYIFTRYPVR